MINNYKDIAVKCPECSHSFEVSEELITSGIKDKIESELKAKYEMEIEVVNYEKENMKKSFQNEVDNKVKLALEKEKEYFLVKIQELQNEKSELAIRSQRVNDKIHEDIEKAKKDQKLEDEEVIQFLKIENKKIHDQAEVNKREKEILLKSKESEVNSKVRLALAEQKSEILTQKDLEKNSLIKENASLKSDIDDLKKRSDQGSVQFQGEIGETFIEDILSNNFPQYSIKEIKKGQKGADCILNINENDFNHAVIFESKLTKNFDQKWLIKLENDIKIHGALYGVLVTDAMPSDQTEPYLINNIWVCQFHDFLTITRGIIELINQVNKVKAANHLTDDQAREMFDYLTGPKFANTINLLLRPINMMSEQLNSEKRAFTKQWAIREKAIDKVFDAVALLHGEISSIGGPSLPEIETIPNVEFLENKNFDI